MSVLKELGYDNANNTLVHQDVGTYRFEVFPVNIVQLSIVCSLPDVEWASYPSVTILEPLLSFFSFLMQNSANFVQSTTGNGSERGAGRTAC